MSLAAGTRLGPYDVLGLIGAGGMGEVYKARDTQLKRDVALKVLPAGVAADPERLARFRREAELLAALNHPHIAQIYGFVDAAPATGIAPVSDRALVMELVDGPTLADRIIRGPLPLDEALSIATQLAEALEYAHERGIIHRDLKPANIKLAPDGAVKMLDFGLAKALSADVSSASADALALSPTMTTPAMPRHRQGEGGAGTELGVILGTAAYMSPEQARGSAVDKRADIWAFGVVLFEMLTGRSCFAGDTVTDILAAVVKSEPDWTALPGGTPARVGGLIRRCLAKDRRQRLRDIGDARIELVELIEAPALDQPDVAPVARPVLLRRVIAALPWAVALTSVAALLVAWLARPAPAPAPAAAHVSVALPPEAPFEDATFQTIAISRDGRHLAYSSGGHLYVRDMSDDAFRRIPGVENGRMQAFSADGLWLAFADPRGLQRVPASGGAPVQILPLANSSAAVWHWTSDGVVLFNASFSSGVMSVPWTGGAPRRLVAPDRARGELLVGHAQQLPDSTDLLLTVCADSIASPDDCQIVLDDPARPGRRAVLVNGTSGRYLPPGLLMFGRGASILAAPLDLRARRLTGPSQPVVSNVATNAVNSVLAASVSDTGTLAYLPGSMQWAGPSSLVVVDRRGIEAPVGRPQPFAIGELSATRDGRRIAVRMMKLNDDIHVLDRAAGTFTRVTDEGGNETRPVWTPDGKAIIYGSSGGVSRRVLDQSAKPELIGEQGAPSAVSPDGRWLLFDRLDPETGQDIWRMALDGGRAAEPLVRTRWNEQYASFSPDGRWVAYQSDESGTVQICVGRFPDMGSKRQVSIDGGTEPVWSPQGDELFFRDRDRLMAVAITAAEQVQSRPPTVVLEHAFKGTRYGGVQYAVLPDGQHFVFPRNAPVEPVRELRLVLNWFEELRAKVQGGQAK